VAEFVDDHRLLVNLQRTSHGPPSLVLIDTGKNVGGAPLWTFFHFSAYFTDAGPLALQMERGAHEPSPAESLASFHRDPAQRIALLHMLRCSKYLILRVGALLELLEIHEGSEIEWDRWRGCLAVPSINADQRGVWVSECRLFSFTCPTDSSADLQVEVYDFSVQGLEKYPHESNGLTKVADVESGMCDPPGRKYHSRRATTLFKLVHVTAMIVSYSPR